MKDNVKRVFYVRYVAHPCYLDIIAARPEIRLDKLENESADEVARPIMAAAHAYQIGSARDELKPRFYVQRELLERMPNLLIVSTNGAGFDTVNVKDCTDVPMKTPRSCIVAAPQGVVGLDDLLGEHQHHGERASPPPRRCRRSG